MKVSIRPCNNRQLLLWKPLYMIYEQSHYIKVVQGGVFSRDCEYLAYFEPKTNIKKIKSHKRDIMQLSSADATMFKKQNEKELPMET